MRLLKILWLVYSISAQVAQAARAVDYALIGPPGGSFKSVEALRDGVCLAGSFNGHLYLSVDNGASWKDVSPEQLTRGMVVEQILYHSKADAVYIIFRDLKRGLLIFAGYEDVVNGLVQPDILLPEAPIRSLALSSTDPPRVFAGTDERLHYSFDGGRTWQQAKTQMKNPEVESLAIDPDDPDLIYAGSWQRAYKTADFGTTWIPIHNGMAPDSDVFSLVFDGKMQLWAGTCGHAYRSLDRGTTWAKKNLGLKGKRIHCLEPADGGSGGDVFAGTDNGLHLFREAADAWLQLIPDIVVHDIAYDNRDGLLIATEGHGILGYRFDPVEIKPLNNGLDASSPKAITGSPDSTLWTGLVYQGSLSGLWRLHQQKWSKVSVECDGANIRDLVINGSHLYAATANGIFRLDLDPDTGLEAAEAKRFLQGKTIKTLHLEPDGVTVLAGGFDGIYVVNTDSGEYAAYPGLKNVNINCIWKCVLTGLMMAGSETALFRKEPGAVQWIPVTLPSDKVRINRISGTRDGRQVYLATSDGIMISYDGGQRFSRFTGRVPGIACLDLAVRGNDVYALMSDHSLYFRKTSDFKWQLLLTLPFDAWSLHAPHDSQLLCIGTPSQGIVRIALRETR